MQEKYPFKDIINNPAGKAIGAGQTVFEDHDGNPINRNNLTKKQQIELDIFLEHKQKEATKSRKTNNNKLKIKKN